MATLEKSVSGKQADQKDARRRFYDPTPIRMPTPGVEVQQGTARSNYGFDFYRGTKEALAAAGVLPLNLFPGEPGSGTKGSVTYWVRGSSPGRMDRYNLTPGRIHVVAARDGTFAATLTVDAEEQSRRLAILDPEASARQAAPVKLKYRDTMWGEMIEGTKSQLQALGLGVDLPFPGEDEGPKKVLTTTDPRGFRTTIEQSKFNHGVFEAHIHFDGISQHPAHARWRLRPMATHPDVKVREAGLYADVYLGSAAALLAAGVISLDHLPGSDQRSVRIRPDGAVVSGFPRTKWHEPGARCVVRIGPDRFEVTVKLSDAESQRRKARDARDEAEWRARMAAIPRPPNLTARPLRLVASAPHVGTGAGMHCQVPRPRANHLRVVWSSPH